MAQPRPRSVLVLDPAASTGWCVMAISELGVVGDIYAFGDIQVDCSSEYQGDWHISLYEKVERLVKAYFIDCIGVEDYFFSKRFASGSSVNAAFRAVIHLLARRHGIPYHVLGISAWKKFITGRVTPTPVQKKQWGKERAKKLYVQESLWLRYHIRLPNHSLSDKTGKPVKFKLDVVDVIGQAIYMAKIILGVYRIEFTAPVAADVVLKGTGKYPAYAYPEGV